jgi:hypothetical protein
VREDLVPYPVLNRVGEGASSSKLRWKEKRLDYGTDDMFGRDGCRIACIGIVIGTVIGRGDMIQVEVGVVVEVRL